MTKLIFVRHGVTAENLNYTLIGHTDPPLHNLGLAQADAVAHALQKEAIDRMYSSPLRRCVDTAHRIAEQHTGLPITIHPALAEIHLGIVEGMSSFLAYERHQSLMDAALDESLPDFQFPSGESRSAALQRFADAVEAIVSAHPTETICVVTHGGPLGLWLSRVQGDPLGQFRRHQPQHASLTCVTFDGGTFRIDHCDATDHLPTDLKRKIEEARQRTWSPPQDG